MTTWVKITSTACLLMIFSGMVKAGGHFIRLALVVILGLIGLYLLHKLAQDYQKIRGPRMASAGRMMAAMSSATRLLRSRRALEAPQQELEYEESAIAALVSRFTNVLLLDPIGCARKFVCCSATKSLSNLTRSEINLMELLRLKHDESGAFRIFQEAQKVGRSTRNETMCSTKYKTCYLSSKQLFSFYTFFK